MKSTAVRQRNIDFFNIYAIINLVMTYDCREQFVNQLGIMIEELERRSLDYRAIGSVAAEATGIFSIDFTPRLAIDEIDRNPDFDIIIPRSELAGAREVRERFQSDNTYPLKLGLAVPSMYVDLRPNDVESLLTWGRHSAPVDSKVFEARDGKVGDVALKTVSPETLRHFYSCLPTQRTGDSKYESYKAKLAIFDHVLGVDTEHTSDELYEAFHLYNELTKIHTPISYRTMKLFGQVTARMTLEQRDSLRKIALRLAGVAGWR